jgi:hypothetical protein
MADVPSSLEGKFEGQPFVVRRARLSGGVAGPAEAKFWEWWTVHLNGVRQGRAVPGFTGRSGAVRATAGPAHPPRPSAFLA